MDKKLPIGYDNFKEVIEKDLYYVDKTHIIEELLDNKNKVVLFPRPRRFGKTLLLSMLENFFNIEKKKDNKHLFDNLYIKNSKYYNNLSSYPVIKLDFKSLKQTNYKVMYGAYTPKFDSSIFFLLAMPYKIRVSPFLQNAYFIRPLIYL